LSGLQPCSTTPTLVLLCGYPDTADMWSPIARHFEKTHHVVSINLPDYENDQLTKLWGHSINGIVNGLHQILLSYKGSDIYLVGHDWGSLVCQFYAERFPRSIVKLVMLDVGKSERGGALDIIAYKKPLSGIVLISYFSCLAICFIISRLSETLALYLISIYPWETIGPVMKKVRFEFSTYGQYCVSSLFSSSCLL
jgi:pimeloyl-ACP methyl ester carboxylesterase